MQKDQGHKKKSRDGTNLRSKNRSLLASIKLFHLDCLRRFFDVLFEVVDPVNELDKALADGVLLLGRHLERGLRL